MKAFVLKKSEGFFILNYFCLPLEFMGKRKKAMKLTCFYPVLLLVCTSFALGQGIRGRLIDSKTQEPIVGANVFIANTSIGAISNEKGAFLIAKIPQNSIELVVAMIGYEAFSLPILVDTLRRRSLNILLKEKVDEIEGITVSAKSINWKANYQTFERNFIGDTENAPKCKIKNPEILNFSSKNGIFRALANDFLIIENKRLGYVLKYKLVDFWVNYSDSYSLIRGYPFFEPMRGTEKQEKKWKKARSQTYKGSSMHLIRSLYQKNWESEGFVLNTLVRIPNTQRPADTLIRRKIQFFTKTIQEDSLQYWIEKSNQPKITETLHKTPLRVSDSLVVAYPENPSLKKLAFKNCIQIVYTKQKPSYLYPVYIKEQKSIMTFNKPFLLLQEDGYAIEALDVTYEGYMPWKKIADLLPLDYKAE